MRCKHPLTIFGLRKNHFLIIGSVYLGLYILYLSSALIVQALLQRTSPYMSDEMNVTPVEMNTRIQMPKQTQKPQQTSNILAVHGIEYVIFNRVPKCASMSMTQLAYDLGAQNNFKVESPYEPGEKQKKTSDEQDQFRSYVSHAKPPYMYIRHQYYVEFDDEMESKVAYINMIRDPISRFESFYYFSRFGNNLGGGGKAKLTEEQRIETIDECISNKRRECVKPWWQVVPYLCGQHAKCLERGRWALERAKDNVDRKYLFVGVLEELPKSLSVLENLLPEFFGGATELMAAEPAVKMRHGTLTVNKKPANATSRAYLAQQTSLQYEYELYHHVLAKLNRLHSKISGDPIGLY